MKTLAETKIGLKPIENQEQYKSYLQIIDTLIDCDEDSPEEELLKSVSDLVCDYEEEHHTI